MMVQSGNDAKQHMILTPKATTIIWNSLSANFCPSKSWKKKIIFHQIDNTTIKNNTHMNVFKFTTDFIYQLEISIWKITMQLAYIRQIMYSTTRQRSTHTHYLYSGMTKLKLIPYLTINLQGSLYNAHYQ